MHLPTFPTAETLPDCAQVDASRLSMRYLVDGEVRVWAGAGADVRAAICWDRDGELERAVLGRLPQIDEAEALAALAAARQAWDHGRGRWPTMPVAGRIACMEKLLAGMAAVREEVVRLLMWEIAKRRRDAESEFDRTVVYVRQTIEALKELDRASGRFQIEEGTIGQTRRSPLGVVLCMGPFNYPLNETFTTLIPALIMGNTIVCKLPKHGGLCQIPLLEAFRGAFPRGAVNILQGDGATVIGPIMASGDVDCLAFIGSSRVANILRRQHPRPNRLRSITGLEAKNPAIILPDADLDVAVKECVSGALSYNGQRCTAIKLIFAHESVADVFLERLCAAVDRLGAGMPWDEGVDLTPLPEEGKAQALAALIDDARAKGARVVNRGGGDVRGTFVRPAVIHPVDPSMRLYHEEQFGPIVPVTRWSHEEEIDAFMRRSPYGQQVSLFGRDPERLGRLVDVMANQVCRINLNTQCRRGPDSFPFTGRKDSAEGTLSIGDALRAFSIRTVCATDTTEANKALVTSIVSGHMSAFLSTDFIL
jgi:glyceraldehyde-3-phosphate dehydrogenase (NADP+)